MKFRQPSLISHTTNARQSGGCGSRNQGGLQAADLFGQQAETAQSGAGNGQRTARALAIGLARRPAHAGLVALRGPPQVTGCTQPLPCRPSLFPFGFVFVLPFGFALALASVVWLLPSDSPGSTRAAPLEGQYAKP